MTGLLVVCGLVLDRIYPPPLPDERVRSVEVNDRDGELLRVFAAPDGRWRLAVSLKLNLLS